MTCYKAYCAIMNGWNYCLILSFDSLCVGWPDTDACCGILRERVRCCDVVTKWWFARCNEYGMYSELTLPVSVVQTVFSQDCESGRPISGTVMFFILGRGGRLRDVGGGMWGNVEWMWEGYGRGVGGMWGRCGKDMGEVWRDVGGAAFMK